ncbi:MAG: hypothetical protein QM768_03115 [Agriterribacter sp.]
MSNLKPLILTVILPLVAGTLLYILLPDKNYGFVRNYVPDGLWAFALTSCLLIIWQGKVHLFWLLIAMAAGSMFEYLQWQGYLNGTGDIFDLICYFVSSLAAVYVTLQKKQIHANNN